MYTGYSNSSLGQVSCTNAAVTQPYYMGKLAMDQLPAIVLQSDRHNDRTYSCHTGIVQVGLEYLNILVIEQPEIRRGVLFISKNTPVI